MRCERCGCRGVFLSLRSFGVLGLGVICEGCESDIGRMGWTVDEWHHARVNFETVQVHNALCRGGGA